MLETIVEKKIPPPLPPKTRRGFLKNADGGGGGSGNGGATILSNGHVVKIRIDPVMGDVDGGGGDGVGPRDEREQSRREHVVGHRSSTVKINITCVDPYVFRRHYSDEDDDEENDHRRTSSGHQSPLDSGTGSDLDTGSRRDESDDGTCSCDSLTSSTADVETPVAAEQTVSTKPVIVAVAPVVVAATPAAVAEKSAVAVVERQPPKLASPPSPAVNVQQRCYGDATAETTVSTPVSRIIDMDNTDQYYSFHMNENVFDEVDASVAAAAAAGTANDTFGGCKSEASCDTIRSAKGTIRGVKNRVRAGIATFLQPKTNKVSQPVSLSFCTPNFVKFPKHLISSHLH